MILHKTNLNNFVHNLADGEQIVRNPRILALMEAKLQSVAPEHRKILATPVFSGTSASETITWTTNAFESEPRKLSSLTGEDADHYHALLKDVMADYESALEAVPPKTRELLKTALTCHSEDTVYCADDHIVLTEWGMHPKGEHNNLFLLGIDYNPNQPKVPDGQELENEEPVPDELVPDEPVVEDNPVTKEEAEPENKPDEVPPVVDSTDTDTTEILPPPPPPPPTPPVDPSGGKKKKKRNWWWLLLLLLIPLLLLLLLLMKSCHSPMAGISPVTSPIDTTKIGLSEDSLTYQVQNRVILLIVSGGSVTDFVEAFREKYPDDKKYILENPDTVIPRIVLTLPVEEKKQFIEGLRTTFPQFDLEVIPETMYQSSKVTNDPAMADEEKRWYFDMCGIFDAWDETMGDENIVVAVIDGGFDLSHPEIRNKIVKPYNAVEHNTNIFPTDEHATHVAATAVGEADNQNGIAGIAPKCKLMPIQVEDAYGNITTSAILDGALYAIAQGADVVNVSLGQKFGSLAQYLPVHVQKNIISNNYLSEQRVWDRVFEMAEARNITFVFAGGNENILVGLDPMKRSAKTIRVSAVQPDRYKTNFSNYGDLSTVSAPGIQIYNAVPENDYAFMKGTSMASPIVAGGVALLKSKNRNYTTKEIITILQETGIPPLSDVGPIVNFANALQGKRTGGSETNCEEVAARYQALLNELEELRRAYPGCAEAPDTLSIPVGAQLSDLYGLWMSTTSLYNSQDEEVVIYFEFNGTAKGNIYLVEPDKTRYSATTSIAIQNDVIYIDQDDVATSSSGGGYNPYSFVCVPDQMRHADGKGVNKNDKLNQISFKLVKIK